MRQFAVDRTGSERPAVPRSEAEQLVDSLTDRDVECEYLCIEDEINGVVRAENRVEYITRTVEVFEANR